MAERILERLKRKFDDAILETRSEHGQESARVDPSRLVEIATFLRDDPELQMDMPIDCTCVDWMGRRDLRFEVSWALYSTRRRHRVRLRVQVGEDDPSCPSLTPVWVGLDWHEREAWDLYGIRFAGHPNLKRVLMYEEFEGHPLRKDYPMEKRQPLVEERPVGDIPTQRDPPASMINRP